MDEIIQKIATRQEPIDMSRLQSLISTSILEYEDNVRIINIDPLDIFSYLCANSTLAADYK